MFQLKTEKSTLNSISTTYSMFNVKVSLDHLRKVITEHVMKKSYSLCSSLKNLRYSCVELIILTSMNGKRQQGT
jgi:hypothetical protein